MIFIKVLFPNSDEMNSDNDIQIEVAFGNLELLAIDATFEEAETLTKKIGGKIATAQQVAQARLTSGLNHSVNMRGSWVAENFVYYPNGKILVTSAEYSPILKHAKEATDAHRRDEEFYLSEQEAINLEKIAAEDSAKNPAERRVYILLNKEPLELSTALAQFLFKKDSTDYISFLKSDGMQECYVVTIPPDVIEEVRPNKPFAMALWINPLEEHKSVNEFRLYANSSYTGKDFRWWCYCFSSRACDNIIRIVRPVSNQK